MGRLDRFGSNSPSVVLDAWAIRNEFLALPTERRTILDFLNKTGEFALAGETVHPVSLEAVGEWQRYLRALMTTPFQEWDKIKRHYSISKTEVLTDNDQFRLTFSWGSHPPEAQLDERMTLRAILATFHIDKARNAKFKFCARHDCLKPFEEGRADKVFCSQYCAHLESLRSMRTRQRIERIRLLEGGR